MSSYSWEPSISHHHLHQYMLLQHYIDDAAAAAAATNNKTSLNDDDNSQYGIRNEQEMEIVYASDDFRMYEYKIKRCPRTRSHDWTECPYAHRGEKAQRRDPRRFRYKAIVCAAFRNTQGSCPNGDACVHAHGVFEYWLHPHKYRTRTCNAGNCCQRKICFFAHSPDQLRRPADRIHHQSTSKASSSSYNNVCIKHQQPHHVYSGQLFAYRPTSSTNPRLPFPTPTDAPQADDVGHASGGDCNVYDGTVLSRPSGDLPPPVMTSDVPNALPLTKKKHKQLGRRHRHTSIDKLGDGEVQDELGMDGIPLSEDSRRDIITNNYMWVDDATPTAYGSVDGETETETETETTTTTTTNYDKVVISASHEITDIGSGDALALALALGQKMGLGLDSLSGDEELQRLGWISDM